jgi:hypothetical protein
MNRTAGRFLVSGVFLLGVSTLLIGCGGDDQQPQNPQPHVRELPQPVVRMVAPTAVSAGETISIIGSGFANPKHNERIQFRFQGMFQGTSGQTDSVDLVVDAHFDNQGLATWRFGPNIPFSSTSETGMFRGTVTVINTSLNGEVKMSNPPLSTQMQVKPSIILTQFRPVNAGCQPGIDSTTSDTPFLIEAKAVGLKAGTPLGPLRFSYTFLKENFTFEGYVGDQLGFDPQSLFPPTGPISVVEEVKDGVLSRLGTGVPRETYVHKGNIGPGIGSIALGTDNLFRLKTFRTASIPDQAGHLTGNIIITAVDSTGAMVSRTVPLTIRPAVAVDYDGSKDRVVRSFDPVAVSGCIAGGNDAPKEVTYAETSTETRSRSYKLKLEGGGSLNILVAQINAGFGMEVQGDVSTSESQIFSTKGPVFPGEFAVWYRQTLQVERVGTVRTNGPCGNGSTLGQVVVTDWIWSSDLAKGYACPPLPISNLGPGKTFD